MKNRVAMVAVAFVMMLGFVGTAFAGNPVCVGCGAAPVVQAPVIQAQNAHYYGQKFQPVQAAQAVHGYQTPAVGFMSVPLVPLVQVQEFGHCAQPAPIVVEKQIVKQKVERQKFRERPKVQKEITFSRKVQRGG